MNEKTETTFSSMWERVECGGRLTSEIIKITTDLSILSEETDEEQTKEKLDDIKSRLIDMWGEAFKLRKEMCLALCKIDRLERELEFRKEHPIKSLLDFR